MVFGRKVPAVLIPSADAPPKVKESAQLEQKEKFSQRLEDLELARQRDEITHARQDQEDRRKFSRRVFGLALGWLLLVLAIVVFNGFSLWSFSLSDQVLIALLTTTTANIIGTLVIVLNYLFPRPK